MPVREGAFLRLLRQPWLTLALALAWGAALPWAEERAREAGEGQQAALDRAAGYLEEHPYLALPAALEQRLSAERVAAWRESFRDRQSRGQGRVPLPQKFREQEELDRLLSASARTGEAIPLQRFGLRASAPEPAALVTHVLLHADARQLACSLALLLLLGAALERRWGSPVFAAAGAFSAAAGGGAFALANPALPTPLVGGTGLCAGLLVGFLVTGVGVWRWGWVAAGALAGALALGSSLWLAAPTLGVAGLASWAAGGGAAGGLAAFALRRLGVGSARPAPRRKAKRPAQARGPLGRALATHGEGRIEKAFLMLVSLLRREPENREALAAMWEVARDVGRPQKGEEALLRAIRLGLREGDPAAVGHWLEFARAPRETPVDLTLLLELAGALRESGHAEASVDALQRALARADAEEQPESAARVAHVALALDRPLAEAAAWCALGSAELPFEERRALEEMLGRLYPPRGQEEDVPALPPGDPAEPPLAVEPEVMELRVVSALPLALDDSSLVLETEGAGKKRVALRRVEALAVAAVAGIDERPVIVIDLLLNWSRRHQEVLKVLRLRADRFAAGPLLPRAPVGGDALRAFLEALLDGSQAVPLPDEAAARGRPFASYPSLDAFERDVQEVGD